MVCLTRSLSSLRRAGRQHREVMRCSLWAYQSSQIVVFKDKPSGALIFPPVKPKAVEFSSSEHNPLLHDTVSLTFSLLYAPADDKKCKAHCKGQQWQALPRDQRMPQRCGLHGREAGGAGGGNTGKAQPWPAREELPHLARLEVTMAGQQNTARALV